MRTQENSLFTDIAPCMADSGEKMGPVARTQLLVVYSGPVGGMVSSRLQAECVEGLLSYARLFFAQPHVGKLSTLAAAGRRVHTVTNWDPGQQSVEAIVQGLAEWKAPEGDSGFSIKIILKEVIRSLFQAPGTAGAIADKATTGWEVAAMSRMRLIVIFPQDLVSLKMLEWLGHIINEVFQVKVLQLICCSGQPYG